MLYIHQTSCISPQQTFGDVDIEHLHTSENNQLKVIEPQYKNIPAGVLRRMSKNVKIGIAAALPLLQDTDVKGIIIGTANGGMEESVKFLNQMVEYDEGLLTPGDFVQSTANAVASQISLMTANKTYNSTHVHRGFSFENALLDAVMLVKENPGENFLVGGVDVISKFNFNIDTLSKCYKEELISNADLYNTNTNGTIAGEGSAMFIVNDVAKNAIAKINVIEFFAETDQSKITDRIKSFIGKENIDLLLSGEDGDNRLSDYYNLCKSFVEESVTIARFKHMTGNYATASALGMWLAVEILKRQSIPAHMIKQKGTGVGFKKVVIYNCYRKQQHSLIELTLP